MAVIGAGTVFGLGWLTLSLFPIIAVIQALSTQVGLAGGRDLPTIVADSQSQLMRWPFVLSILVVNVVTIAADLEAGAAALGLLVDADWRWFVLPLSVVLLTLLLAAGYHQVQRALKYLLLCLLAYVVATVRAQPDWGEVVRGSLVPHFPLNGEYIADALSLLGTTLTSYVYIWQTIGQAEEQQPWRLYRTRQIDSAVGSFFAVAIMWFILVATGSTLGVDHLRVDTAAQAAQALRPVAGDLAGALFALGLLASAVVALPVIMATTAYVTGAQLKWRRGLSLRISEAPLFYGALIAATVLGTVVTFSGVAPIRLLFVAGIVGGVATPIGLIMLLRVAGDRKLMNDRPAARPLLVAGWVVTTLITTLGLAYIVQQLVSHG
ncbi:divalent metal cation transporter [Pseudonocardia sp. K10HN5]|uniref:Divalent metal cation transporter n=2 Tax=Pseudonocardia acidicola TaxID=2724939 RepID=A0ABX1S720_9PSEU|nr:divalent metal cation transporter [Pseudonocardia acidicola]